MFQLDPSKKFRKRFSKLQTDEQKAIEQAMRRLADNPGHPSLRFKKVKGRESVFEASASMDLRITCRFEGNHTIRLRNCGHHDDTLRNP